MFTSPKSPPNSISSTVRAELAVYRIIGESMYYVAGSLAVTWAPEVIKTCTHGRPQGGGGHLPLPGIYKNDVICCRSTKYPKFFPRPFGACYIYPIF